MRGRRSNYAWNEISVEQRIKRFMCKVVQRPDGHWEWIGKRFKNGYGSIQLSLEPRQKTYHLAHRVSWTLFVGPIPDGLFVLHHCDLPWCVNPDCLFVGTARDNRHDMLSKGRGNPARGERCARCKVSDADVAIIREERRNGVMQVTLAQRFKVSQKQISIIVNNKQRKDPNVAR